MTVKKIDAFGKVTVDDGPQIRARVIQLTATEYALFSDADPKVPMLITGTGPARVNGRNLVVELIGGGLMRFQRASCGCQTPSTLRGPQSQFLSRIPAPADT